MPLENVFPTNDLHLCACISTCDWASFKVPQSRSSTHGLARPFHHTSRGDASGGTAVAAGPAGCAAATGAAEQLVGATVLLSGNVGCSVVVACKGAMYESQPVMWTPLHKKLLKHLSPSNTMVGADVQGGVR